MKKPQHKKPQRKSPPPTNVAQQIESTLGAELRKLKTECGKAHHRYTSEKDPILAQVHVKQWMQLSSQVTAMAKVQPKADTEAGSVLKASDVEQTWSRSMTEFRKTLESMSRRISTNALFARLDPIDVEEVVNKEVAAALTQLSHGGWLGNKDQEKAA
jgi:hypothetical protein